MDCVQAALVDARGSRVHRKLEAPSIRIPGIRDTRTHPAIVRCYVLSPCLSSSVFMVDNLSLLSAASTLRKLVGPSPAQFNPL